jgi:hypothetical protein
MVMMMDDGDDEWPDLLAKSGFKDSLGRKDSG